MSIALLFPLGETTFGQDTLPTSKACAKAGSVPKLTVDGHGEVKAQPDRAMIGLGVEGQADTATGAQEAVSASMQKVIKNIEKAGIQKQNIRTSGLNLSPIYAAQKPGQENEPPRIVGYRASNSIQLEVPNLQTVGQVIDAAMVGGANRLEGVSFGLEDDLKYRKKALQLAAEEAKMKAQTLAQALDVRLVSVWTVSQVAVNVPRPLHGFAGLERAAMAPTPVQSGQIKVEATVTVEYQIKPLGRTKESGKH